MNGSLPPLLSPGLAVVFVGTEPGAESMREGYYYADPSNRFYADLCTVGFTPKQLAPADHQLLLRYRIGLDDVYEDPLALKRRITEAAPRAVCFNSKAALARFAERRIPANVWRGRGAQDYARLAGITWAVEDSSGRCGYHAKRLQALEDLRRLLDVASTRIDAPRSAGRRPALDLN
jgi:TDG/mug DNA glycosylase family protein